MSGTAGAAAKPSHTSRHSDRMLFEEATRIMSGNVGVTESASSFMDDESAQVIIDDVISRSGERISAWLAEGAPGYLELDVTMTRDDMGRLEVPVMGIGLTVDRTSRKIWVVRSSDVRVVLRGDADDPRGFSPHTAFPLVMDDHGERLDVDALPYFVASPMWSGASPTRRAFYEMSCSHGDEDPTWYEEQSDSLELPVVEGGERLGWVFANESRTCLWCIGGCEAARLSESMERAVMPRAYPETWARIRAACGTIAKHRAHKELERGQTLEVEPFVPDIRLRAIANEARAVIRAAREERERAARRAEAQDQGDAPAPAAGAEASGAPATAAPQSPVAGPQAAAPVRDGADVAAAQDGRAERASRRARRMARGASAKAKAENERRRAKREREEARTRRRAERREAEGQEALEEAAAGLLSAALGGLVPQAGADAPGDGIDRSFPGGSLPNGTRAPAAWGRRRAVGSEVVLDPLEFWHVPRYDPTSGDVIVPLVGLDSLTDMPVGDDAGDAPHSSRLGAIVLHADEADIEAALGRMRELNAELADAIGRDRERILSERGDGNGTVTDGRGEPVRSGGRLLVDERDVAHDAQEGADIYFPEWWRGHEDDGLTVETPWPRPLGHLVDEGRYDLVTIAELERLRSQHGRWSALCHADLLVGLSARIALAPAPDGDAPAWPLARVTGGRLLAVPSYHTKVVPSTEHMDATETLAARIAKSRADGIREGRGAGDGDELGSAAMPEMRDDAAAIMAAAVPVPGMPAPAAAAAPHPAPDAPDVGDGTRERLRRMMEVGQGGAGGGIPGVAGLGLSGRSPDGVIAAMLGEARERAEQGDDAEGDGPVDEVARRKVRRSPRRSR